MECVDIMYCRKIRIFPNTIQKELFNKCFNASRYIYNKGVEYLNNQYKTQYDDYKSKSLISCVYKKCTKQCLENSFFCKKHKTKKLKWNLDLNFISLRGKIAKNNCDLDDKEKWLLKVPTKTRQYILEILITNYKSAITNKIRGNIKTFNMGFMKKRSKNHIFCVEKNAIKKLNLFPRLLKKQNTKIRVSNKNKFYNDYDPTSNCLITKRCDRYYLLMPKKRTTNYTEPKYNTVSLDPGMITFQTFYSPDGECGKMGDKFYKKIWKKMKRIDKLKSIIYSGKKNNEKITKRTKYNMKKRCDKLRVKVKNMVKDLHWKTCSYLVKNYKTIILPEFSTQDMVKRSRRNIPNYVVRMLLQLSHYSFKEKLKYKCNEYQRKLLITSEAYTSKTCTNCGHLNCVGKKRKICCFGCNIKIDRDLNGARNIYLRAVEDLTRS